MSVAIVIPVHAIALRRDTIKQNIAFAQGDDRISEVVLSCEPGEVIAFSVSKVRIFVNLKREYVFRNKYLAVEHSTADYCIILDSDNTIDRSYVDGIFKAAPWNPKTAYQPEFARPSFDFRQFSGRKVDRSNAKFFMPTPAFRVMINAMNYFVNRETYLTANKETFDSGFDPKCADSLQVNYNLLKNGCNIFVVPGLQYDHKVHDGSFYKEAVKEYGHLTKELENKIVSL